MRETRFTIASLVLVALCAAATKARASSEQVACHEPAIVGIDTKYLPDGYDEWLGVYTVTVNAYGKAGTVVYNKGEVDNDQKDFGVGTQEFEATFDPSLALYTGEDDRVTFDIATGCGVAHAVMRSVVPRGKHWARSSHSTGSSPKLDCPAVLIIDSRGSGETSGALSPPAQKFVQFLKQLRPGANIQAFDNPYPAVSIIGGWRHYLNLIGARLPLPKLGAYNDSVGAGERLLNTLVPRETAVCPSTKIVLSGYSQGAQVAGNYTLLNPHDVAATVLFGDPKFNPSDVGDRGGFDKRLSGALGTRPYFARSSFVLSFCHRYDPVCQFSLGSIKTTFQRHGVTQHENYDRLAEGGLTDPKRAARLVASKLLP